MASNGPSVQAARGSTANDNRAADAMEGTGGAVIERRYVGEIFHSIASGPLTVAM